MNKATGTKKDGKTTGSGGSAEGGGRRRGGVETATGSRHLLFGWRMLLVFLAVGLGLEIMHGLKLDWYLSVGHETRRLMFTLAHAHGALFSIVNVLFGLTLLSGSGHLSRVPLISRLLIGGTILLPLGFFLGGLVILDGDPGYGVVLAPVGAGLLVLGVALIAGGLRTD